jgi:hypothetical protein
MIRAAVVVAMLLGSSPAHAIPCSTVKEAVARYGAAP